MKKLFLFLCCAMLCVVATACQKQDSTDPGSSSAVEQIVLPDPTRPDGAIAALMEGLKSWDTDAFSSYLPEGFSVDKQVPPQFRQIIADAFAQMEYQITHTQITGDTAAVEMTITAVEASSAASKAISAATSYAVKQQLIQAEIDIPTMIDTVVDAVDISSLPTQTATCTVYMVKQTDGTWHPDTTDERNLDFLNAASGGSMELVNSVMELADQYGFSLQ